MIRLSAGTAHILGLKRLQTDVEPTTGYFLTGDRCRGHCAFCPQGQGNGKQLSRIIWPEYSYDTIAGALKHQSKLRRYCFQTADSPGWIENTKGLLARLQADQVQVPVCVSCKPRTLSEIKELLNAGANRVSIALDACSPAVAAKVGREWQSTFDLLVAAAQEFPGRISTHLIIGLGESEQEAIASLRNLLAHKITIALFAFMPVKGTAMADHPQPPLARYRRIQAALFLAKVHSNMLWQWTDSGELILTKAQLKALEPEAFQTSGCPDCNRPYYNEKPGGVMYNYPRPLTNDEFRQCLKELESC